MYFLFAFAYTVPVPHLPYIFKKVTHKNFTDKLFFHSALISKKVVYNNAIFRKDKTYFKYFYKVKLPSTAILYHLYDRIYYFR